MSLRDDFGIFDAPMAASKAKKKKKNKNKSKNKDASRHAKTEEQKEAKTAAIATTTAAVAIVAPTAAANASASTSVQKVLFGIDLAVLNRVREHVEGLIKAHTGTDGFTELQPDLILFMNVANEVALNTRDRHHEIKSSGVTVAGMTVGNFAYLREAASPLLAREPDLAGGKTVWYVLSNTGTWGAFKQT